MKFEDLFKAKEPNNYVEQESQGQDPLNKFFQDPIRRSLQEKAVKAQKAKQPITPEKEMAIKKNFSLPPQPPIPEQQMPDDGMEAEFNKAVAQETPEVPTQQMAVPSQVPQISIPDLGRREEKEVSLSDRAEKMLPERTWTDFLPYLAPLIAEGFMGVDADATGIAGSALLKSEQDRIKRKQTLEDKLLDMDKTRLSKMYMGGKGQAKSLRNKLTGESVIGVFDPRTNSMTVDGRQVDTSQYELAPGLSRQEFEVRSGITQQRQKDLGEFFGRGVRVDPDTGLLARVINGKLIPIQVQKGQLNPKQGKDLRSIVTNFKSTDVYKKNADTLKFAQTVQSLLVEGNPVAIEMARSELAKAAEGGGRLSDADVERLGGSKAIREQIDRFTYLQSTGESATPKDVVFMQRVADILENKARKNLSQSIIGLEQDFVENYGGVPGAVQTALNPYAPQLAEKPSAESKTSGMVKVQNIKTRQVGYIPRKNLSREALKKYRVVK